jgi:hypothetical protein
MSSTSSNSSNKITGDTSSSTSSTVSRPLFKRQTSADTRQLITENKDRNCFCREGKTRSETEQINAKPPPSGYRSEDEEWDG